MQFDAYDSKLDWTRSTGHFARFGHELTGYWTAEEFPRLVRTCC